MIGHFTSRLFLLLLFIILSPWTAVFSFGQITLSKEYIYLGDRIIAVETSGTTPGNPPTGLVATGVSASLVNLSWSAPSSGPPPHHYGIWRKSGGVYTKVNTTFLLSYPDTVSPSTAYLYKVSAENISEQVLGYTNEDLATTVSFTEDPLGVGMIVKADHISQLRTAVNAVRAAAGLSAASWTYTVATGSLIHAVDVTELRSNLNQALTSLGLALPTYTDAQLFGVAIKRAHFQELRQGVK